jgi:hypothetical protein
MEKMKVKKECITPVISQSIGAIHRAKRALYAAAALHTIAPLLLLTCLFIPIVLSTHG